MMKGWILKNGTGILYALGIALIAKLLLVLWPGAILARLGFVTIAILLAIVAGNLWKTPASFSPGIRFSEKRILEIAIALMGFQLDFSQFGELGYEMIPLIIGIMTLSIVLSILVAPRLGMRKNLAALLGIGNAVCGTAAIAALAPLLKAKEEEVGISVGVINFLGTLGLFVLPPLALSLQLQPSEGGILMGGSLQAVGHAVAAGFSLGDLSGQMATVVKMGRVLMLGPAVLALGFLFRKNGSAGKTKKGFKIPPFILFFIAFMLMSNLIPVPEPFLLAIQTTSKWLLAIAMAAIGSKIVFKDLKTQGPRALLWGLILFLFQAAVLLIYILFS